MNNVIFDSAFFGYSNLPTSIEVDNRKLVPIKTLNLFSKGTHFVQYACKLLKIKIYRPVKGLLCVEEQYVQVLDYLYENYVPGRYTTQSILDVFSIK